MRWRQDFEMAAPGKANFGKVFLGHTKRLVEILSSHIMILMGLAK